MVSLQPGQLSHRLVVLFVVFINSDFSFIAWTKPLLADHEFSSLVTHSPSSSAAHSATRASCV